MENNQEGERMKQGAGGSSKWLWWVLGVILLGAVGFGGFWVGQNLSKLRGNTTENKELTPVSEKIKTEVVPIQPLTQETGKATRDSSDTLSVKKVTAQFMDYYIYKSDEIKKNADLEKMFALFTPPANSDEQDTLDFLLIKDTPEISDKGFATRIYNTATYGDQAKSYTLGEVEVKPGYFFIPVTIKTFVPAGTGGLDKDIYGTKKCWFKTVKSGNEWRVDQFYSDSWTDSRDVIPSAAQNQNAQVKKYSCF